MINLSVDSFTMASKSPSLGPSLSPASLLLRAGSFSWPSHGLRAYDEALARHALESQHLDFHHAVSSALELHSFETPLMAASGLHDLALRRAQALCRLQGERLAWEAQRRL